MKNHIKIVAWGLVGFVAFSLVSCEKEDNVEPMTEGVERAELILTEVSGEGVEAHGDHFHGLGNAVAGETIVVKFDENGVATSSGHLHLEAEAIYKIELKAWDYDNREVQNNFIADKETADQYKVFLVGGDFVLNPDSDHEGGAIFQPREQQYADGSAVDGQFETTGILSYFTVGRDNERPTVEVTYVLRKLNAGVKETITRTDWNRKDYASEFAGENVLELKFEIHAEHGDHHDH